MIHWLLAALEGIDHVAGVAMLPLAAWILVSGADDLIMLAAYLWARVRGNLPLPPAHETLAMRRQSRIAIYVPLWREEAVIGGMLDHNLAAIRYRNYDFFVGAYPNDAGTVRAVRAAEQRSGRVHLALCPHDGPTSKADCLNWIYQRMLLYEREHGVEFDLVMMHDAEDLIHPDELLLMNHYSAAYDMIQTPVLPLPTPWRDWTHGIYCDDFAEFHTKDLPARWFLGGFIPSCGVGTAFTRNAIEALAMADSNLVFKPDCLTEDYETGHRLHQLGFKQLFMPIYRPGRGQEPVATREYFPRSFHAARKQRSRWTTGIALQAWARHGWGKSWRETYWFLHDRKGLVGNPASLGANILFAYGIFTWLLSLAGLRAWGLSAQTPAVAQAVLPWLGALGAVLCFARLACSASIYGWAFAIWAPMRAVAGNLLNTMAATQAISKFARSIWFGEPLVWLKTEHAYPNLAALGAYKPSLEAILLSMGAVRAEALEEARKASSLASLSDQLLALRAVSQEDLLEALMLRHSLPGGELTPNELQIRHLRILPAHLSQSALVLPIRLREGRLTLACPDLPGEEALQRIQEHVRFPLDFYLVTRQNFGLLQKMNISHAR